MKKLTYLKLFTLSLMALLISACGDDDAPVPMPTGMEDNFALFALNNSGVSGTITFEEADLGGTIVTIDLNGTVSGESHPSHIHFNTAAEGGDIAVSLTPVDGATGMSETYVEALDNGTAISYSELMTFDGYVNVHLSADDLATVVAQGDIGVNELTGESNSYNLFEKDVDGVSGTFMLERRVNGTALATVMLTGTQTGGSHPGHIHDDNAATGGAIAVSLNPVDGATGISKTSIEMKDDGTAITYDELLAYDGYVNIHNSVSDLGTLIAQGDIGENELTSTMKSYDLSERDVAGVSGTFTLTKRVNGEALAVVNLSGTTAGGMHPGHIHANAAVEGGEIVYSFNPVDGATGMSVNNIAALDDGTAITYDELLDFNGYVNIHNSANDLGTLLAQGDIGANELTGMSTSYDLAEVDQAGTSGTIMFMERKDGTALIKIELQNTLAADSHPGHIHENSAAQGGGILFTFNNVNGATGTSLTNMRKLDDDTAIGYADIATLNGYVNIHKSASDLATLVAQGDIGANDN